MASSIKQSASAPLKVAQLEADIKSGKIDTVVGRTNAKRGPCGVKIWLSHPLLHKGLVDGELVPVTTTIAFS